MKKALRNKKKDDLEWSHKNLCLKHHIKPIASSRFTHDQVPSYLFDICQCGQSYQEYIENGSKQCQYQVGLNKLIKNGEGSQRFAHYTDLIININPKNSNKNEHFVIQLHSLGIDAIRKLTSPSGKGKEIATGCFFNDYFIQEIGQNWVILWSLKNAYREKRLNVEREDSRRKAPVWWYENWAIHGLIEPKNTNFHCHPFIALHNNVFIGGTSREACENRIILYVYSKNGEEFNITINGTKLTNFTENIEQKQENDNNNHNNSAFRNSMNEQNQHTHQRMINEINELRTSVFQHRASIQHLVQQCESQAMLIYQRDVMINNLREQTQRLAIELNQRELLFPPTKRQRINVQRENEHNNNKKRRFGQMETNITTTREGELIQKIKEYEKLIQTLKQKDKTSSIFISAGLDSMNAKDIEIINLRKQIKILKEKYEPYSNKASA